LKTIENGMRVLEFSDAEAVCNHVNQVCIDTERLYHPNFHFWLAQEYNVDIVQERIVAEHALGFFKNGQLVGTGFIDLKTGWISGVYVSLQGEGIGSKILDDLISVTVGTDLTNILASVHPTGGSMRHLLLQKGFVNVGIDPHRIYFPDVSFEVFDKPCV